MEFAFFNLSRTFSGWKRQFKAWCQDERGDTNFLSIMIILGIVLALAVIFIAFKESIVEYVQNAIDGFFGTTGGGGGGFSGGGFGGGGAGGGGFR